MLASKFLKSIHSSHLNITNKYPKENQHAKFIPRLRNLSQKIIMTLGELFKSLYTYKHGLKSQVGIDVKQGYYRILAFTCNRIGNYQI